MRNSRRLNAYRSYFEELLAVRIVQNGIPCSVTLNYEENGGTKITTELPPDEDVVVLLLRLRPLILNDEHASFNRITGILGKHIQEPLVRAALKLQREIFDGRSMQQKIIVTSHVGNNEIIINSEKALSVWLNAYEYHRDQNKKREIDQYHQLLPLAHSKAFFLMLLSDKVRAIVSIARFVDIILGKADTARL